MKLVIIHGPSGSGKTTLSKKILKKIKNGFSLSTDNYYKTGIISKILSKLVESYFDRSISFNLKLFKKDLNFINKNRISNHSYIYNFKNQIVKKIKKKFFIDFLIIEGIFANKFLNYLSRYNFLLIELKTTKDVCMNRVINRDLKKRGKNKIQAKKDFLKAWELFYKNKENHKSENYVNKLVLTKEIDVDFIMQRIANLKN